VRTSPSAELPVLHHVALRVSQLDRAIAWYGAALGFAFEERRQTSEGVTIGLLRAPAGFRLELFALMEETGVPVWDAPVSALRSGHGHICFAVVDLDETFAHAMAAGARAVWQPRPSERPGRRIAFVADPDGNLVELISDAAP
jgi:catechol 2,3-dioxygenase-like lactoylglutathione lyase family enzyme